MKTLKIILVIILIPLILNLYLPRIAFSEGTGAAESKPEIMTSPSEEIPSIIVSESKTSWWTWVLLIALAGGVAAAAGGGGGSSSSGSSGGGGGGDGGGGGGGSTITVAW